MPFYNLKWNTIKTNQLLIVENVAPSGEMNEAISAITSINILQMKLILAQDVFERSGLTQYLDLSSNLAVGLLEEILSMPVTWSCFTGQSGMPNSFYQRYWPPLLFTGFCCSFNQSLGLFSKRKKALSCVSSGAHLPGLSPYAPDMSRGCSEGWEVTCSFPISQKTEAFQRYSNGQGSCMRQPSAHPLDVTRTQLWSHLGGGVVASEGK